MKNLVDMTDEELALSYIDGSQSCVRFVIVAQPKQKLFSYIVFVVHDRDLA